MTAAGSNPASRALMSTNFSAPKSEPNPASVTTISAKSRAVSVAKIELQPCAIFAMVHHELMQVSLQLIVLSLVLLHLLKSLQVHLPLLNLQL